MLRLGITGRVLIFTLFIALVGAVVCGLLVFFYFQDFRVDGWRTNPNISAIVISVVGFISCFVAFKNFITRVGGGEWGDGLKYGLIICSLLGIFLGFITGIVAELSSSTPNIGDVFFLAVIGVFIRGLPIGIVIGLVFGPIFTLIINRFNLSYPK